MLLDTNKVIIRSLFRFETADSILNWLGVIQENGIIHLNESQLKALFNSSLASDEIIANRIDGFPIYSEESNIKLIILKYWYLFGIGILTLLILILFLFSKRDNGNKQTSP